MTIETVEQIEQIEKIETIEQGENIMTENIETIATEFVETEQAEQSKHMFTISKDMLVVSTTNSASNPVSENYDAMKLFLDNNFSTLEDYFNDENNYGIAFHECGFSGKAQDEFVEEWLENGVRVF